MVLNDKQMILLLLVNDHCNGKTFFVPGYSGDIRPVNVGRYVDGRLETVLEDVFIHGAVCSVFKALERKGLIKRPNTTLRQDYIYEITEEGRMHVEKYRRDDPSRRCARWHARS